MNTVKQCVFNVRRGHVSHIEKRNQMTKTITAHEATVKTATVDVKALTISGRQVTLSVFRQLKDEPILDEDTVMFRGVPWGMVNYFWGDCAKASEHLHIVWQKGDELRRGCVFPNPGYASGWNSRKQRVDRVGEFLIFALVATHADAAPIEVGDSRYGGKDLSVWGHDRWVSWPMRSTSTGYDQVRKLLALSDERHHRYRTIDNEYRRETDEEMESRVSQKYEEEALELWDIIRQRCGTTSLETIQQALNDDVKKLADFEQRWRDQYNALASLDHLFIAV